LEVYAAHRDLNYDDSPEETDGLDEWTPVSKTEELPYGAIVRIGFNKKLKNPKLNGKYGLIVCWHKKHKSYKVQISVQQGRKSKIVNVPCGASLEKNGFMHNTGAEGFAGYNWEKQNPAHDIHLYSLADRMYGMRDTFVCQSQIEPGPGGSIDLQCRSKAQM
jgi:hypothetical protein